ncbi:hypothetical protein BJ878DRAFT_334555 [Calycina marina]|uniref:Ricin B lectin domain-containing protein n=1 Tax=Calycina marina TaxID=1763456 RepID=A0A9P8CG16_9HELO|nr:hypothetical protein BJ878DRAFT_334555 [Calycina marina]
MGDSSQKWDIITAGKHNDQPGTMLVVSSEMQGCMNFDPRRKAANQALMFSCGGRADGRGHITNSQLFNLTQDATSGPLANIGTPGTCFDAKGSAVDQAPCSFTDPLQQFNFGASGASPSSAPSALPGGVFASLIASIDGPSATITSVVAGITPFPISAPPSATTAGPISVSRAGGVLQRSAFAEAQSRDKTATRAFSGVQVKDSVGNCLFVDKLTGDFRGNLIPVAAQNCTGAAGEGFDFITSGRNNDQSNSILIVSCLTNGCLNFDDRRAAGDQVVLFSRGGRADGGGETIDLQLFPFTTDTTSFALSPLNAEGKTCLVTNNGKLDQTACFGDASQLFTIGSQMGQAGKRCRRFLCNGWRALSILATIFSCISDLRPARLVNRP